MYLSAELQYCVNINIMLTEYLFQLLVKARKSVSPLGTG